MPKNTNFFSRLWYVLESAKEADRDDLVTELEKVKTFAVTGLYMPRGTVRDLELYLTKSNREICQITGLSVGAVTQRRLRYSTALYNLFGDDFFELPLHSNGAEEIKQRLQNATFSLDGKYLAENLVVTELVARVKDQERYNTYNLRDCEYEIRLLERFSRPGLHASLQRADLSKLRYLISVLEGEVASLEDQLALRTIMQDSKGFVLSDALRKA